MSESSDSILECNIVARKSAFAVISDSPVQATSLISYHSKGRLLILAEAAEFAQQLKEKLQKALDCTIMVVGGAESTSLKHSSFLYASKQHILINGFLGAFELITQQIGLNNNQQDPLQQQFDLVLDALDSPIISAEIKPPGYYLSSPENQDLDILASEISSMTGDFEKPKYVEYDASVCAHGRSGQKGCSRCLDACPAQAITSLADTININAQMCHGMGICATTCPTGAIRYHYPSTEDTCTRIRQLLKRYLQEGGLNPQLLVIDETVAAEMQIRDEDDWLLPGNILPVVLEEQGGIGLDVWLAGLAYGAQSIILLKHRKVPESVVTELVYQASIAQSLLAAMGYPEAAVTLCDPSDITAGGVNGVRCLPNIIPAEFAAQRQKRTTIFMAIDHLFSQSESKPSRVELPEQALFGKVLVDQSACTLCMSCVSVCPAGALSDGGDTPKLKFYHGNCVQCGLCKVSCPEKAITLVPEFIFDPEQRRRLNVLHEEQPFCCISCNKPFATQSVITRILEKLESHAMFQDESARQRLKMCDECRVLDMMRDEQKQDN